MFRTYLIPTLNYLTKTGKSLYLVRNDIHHKRIATDVRLCRSFATIQEFSEDKLEKVAFKDVKSVANDKNVVIIDVREPKELIEHGVLTGSINIPLGEVENALKNMSEDQFLKKYGRSKPDKKMPIIFSCMKGMRSEKAQIAALQLGYKNVKNYFGGWSDWAEKNK